MRDPYHVLGVQPLADSDTIRAAYNRLAQQLRPGCSESPFTQDRLIEATYAYDLLMDPRRRRLYDEYGEAALRPDFDPRRYSSASGSRGEQAVEAPPRARTAPGFEPGFERISDSRLEDVLRSVGHRPRPPQKGRSQTIELSVEFMMTVLGGTTELPVPRDTGVPELVQVSIPAGARNGGCIFLPGRGHPSASGPPGDLIVKLKVKEHPHLRRRGDELEMDVPITILEALRGSIITVPTPAGEAQVTIPPGASSNGRLVLPGHGIQRKPRPGNLYLILRPTIPDRATPEDVLAAYHMEPNYSHPVRSKLKL